MNRQEGRLAAEKAYDVAKVDERVNRAVAAASRAANAARVAAVKAVQKQMHPNVNRESITIPVVWGYQLQLFVLVENHEIVGEVDGYTSLNSFKTLLSSPPVAGWKQAQILLSICHESCIVREGRWWHPYGKTIYMFFFPPPHFVNLCRCICWCEGETSTQLLL